jgi:membrane protease YdiL (CAAX protease family)
MNISNIFIDRSNKLRSGWRFAIFAALCVPAIAVLAAAAYPIMYGLSAEPGTPLKAFIFMSGSIIMLIPAVGVGWFCGWTLERLPFRALGAWFTRGWFSHFAWGCLIGGLTLLVAVLAAAAGGGLSFGLNSEADSASILQTLAVSLLVFAVAAASEEVLFRGYPLQTFARSGLAWFAILMTSLFFGLAHFSNPGANLISMANTTLAGIWFGVAYLKTRDLWFVWGLHLVWNWLQGAIFGIEVSGLTEITRSPVLRETDVGPAWLTGGEYGLEGGIACTVALILSAIAIHFLPFTRPDDEMLALTSPTGVQPSHLPGGPDSV